MVEEIRAVDKDTLILITTAYSSEEYLLQVNKPTYKPLYNKTSKFK